MLVTGVSGRPWGGDRPALRPMGQVWSAPRAILPRQAATAKIRPPAANGGGLELVELDRLACERARRADALLADGGISTLSLPMPA